MNWNSKEENCENEDSEVDVAVSQRDNSDSVYSETDNEYDESEDEDSESEMEEDDFNVNGVYIKNGISRYLKKLKKSGMRKIPEYIHQGMSEEQAKGNAYMKTLWVL